MDPLTDRETAETYKRVNEIVREEMEEAVKRFRRPKMRRFRRPKMRWGQPATFCCNYFFSSEEFA